VTREGWLGGKQGIRASTRVDQRRLPGWFRRRDSGRVERLIGTGANGGDPQDTLASGGAESETRRCSSAASVGPKKKPDPEVGVGGHDQHGTAARHDVAESVRSDEGQVCKNKGGKG
jgi:hypothetical protein